MKICAFCAGDANIVYPALVALASAKRFNPGIGLVLCTDARKLADDAAGICRDLGIAVVDVMDAGVQSLLEPFAAFGRWPKETWLGIAVLGRLKALGFSHAVKLDWDVVCMRPWDLSEALPRRKKGELMSAVCKGRTLADCVRQDELAAFDRRFGVSAGRLPSLNAGVMAFDLEACGGLAARLAEAFAFASGTVSRFQGETVEQWLLGAAPAMFGMKCRPLPPEWNFRPVPAEVGLDRKNVRSPVNVHFTTVCKPWIPFDPGSAAGMELRGGKDSKFRQLLFFNVWIREANRLPFRGFRYRKEEWTPEELCRAWTDVRARVRKRREEARLLERMAEAAAGGCPLLPPPVFGKDGRYAMFPLSKDGKLHFELLQDAGGVKCCLHFEGRWQAKAEAGALAGIAAKLSFLNVEGDPASGGIYVFVPASAGPDAPPAVLRAMASAVRSDAEALARKEEEAKD